MTAPDGRSGRRSNGLAAAEFGALVDLDPRLSTALLDLLRSAGVAAYVEPAGEAQPLVRSVVLPSRPLDRLWVDPARADEARRVVSAEVADLTALLAEQDPGATAHGFVQPVPRLAARRVLTPPELPGVPAPATPTPAAPTPEAADTARETDPDEVFRQIVAGLQADTPDGPVSRWPVTEDLDDERPARAAGPDGGGLLRRRTDPTAAGSGADTGLPDWLEPDALDDRDGLEDEGYEPPPPPKVPRIQWRSAVSVAGVVLGLLFAFAPSLVGQIASSETLVVGLAMLLGGAWGLVSAVRDAPEDSPPDDGAVV